jgi:hypothetical protein
MSLRDLAARALRLLGDPPPPIGWHDSGDGLLSVRVESQLQAIAANNNRSARRIAEALEAQSSWPREQEVA